MKTSTITVVRLSSTGAGAATWRAEVRPCAIPAVPAGSWDRLEKVGEQTETVSRSLMRRNSQLLALYRATWPGSAVPGLCCFQPFASWVPYDRERPKAAHREMQLDRLVLMHSRLLRPGLRGAKTRQEPRFHRFFM